MRQIIISIAALLLVVFSANAQRLMENLGRGLVAMQSGSGIYLSWRLPGQEWYDVCYNVYRDGKKINSLPLTTSNYYDLNGTLSSEYRVSAVIKGIEQSQSDAVKPWADQYIDIPVQPIIDNAGNDISHLYSLNDASAADLDGDGEYELIVKRMNFDFSLANKAYTLFQAYKMDGTLLWTIDVGPNIMNSRHVETNCMAFDFNQDGCAEVVIRLSDGSILPDGSVVGDSSINYRTPEFDDLTCYQIKGDEWLYILEGNSGKVIDSVIFDADEINGNNLARRDVSFWWNGNKKAYGHRANKFHFGAPYLDGRKPSIYIGRGCYTNIHMATYDLVDNKLVLRWTYSNDNPNSKFYGQGYHNFSIVDVDEDGRDEICHGNMVIDEYGKELSSTGLGHGDAQHYGDFDPYRKGLEGFRCLEDNPGAVFVDATTNEILFQWFRSTDNGRCLAGNFTDKWPGAELWTLDNNLWSATLSRGADETIDNKAPGVTMNFRIYWDGDILDESFDYASRNTNGDGIEGAVFKYGNSKPIFVSNGCMTNNNTKGNPCLQADLFGDWREEIVLRTSDNKKLRIYTTNIPTEHRIYTLMHDKQYRQAIYWQMTAYNQPPHVSYFLGNAEGITIPPPPVMSNGRVIITKEINFGHNGKHLLLTDAEGGTVRISEETSPHILTVNSLEKDWTLHGSALKGDMRLIKQGQGAMTLYGNHSYTGITELWEGTSFVYGSLESHVWLNRFAQLNTDGIYHDGITVEYGATLRIEGNNSRDSLTSSTVNLKNGAVMEIDLFPNDKTADMLIVKDTLNISEGAIFRFNYSNDESGSKLAGAYLIGEVANINGNLNDVKIEGLNGCSYELKLSNNKIYLIINDMRAPADVVWTGANSSIWNLMDAENFMLGGLPATFVTGDNVTFDETAKNNVVDISVNVEPHSVMVKGDADYTIIGDGGISGGATFAKSGNGTLVINNINNYTGKTLLSGGKVQPSRLATTQSAGALGAFSSDASNFVMQNDVQLIVNGEVFQESPMTLGDGGAIFNVTGTLHLKGAVQGTTLTKSGDGTLNIYDTYNTYKKTVINAGTLNIAKEYNDNINGRLGDTIVLNGGTLQCHDNKNSYSTASWNIVVPEGKTATIRLDSRCNYTGKLTGSGTLNLYVPFIRTYLQGNWSEFRGTICCSQSANGDFTFDNNYGLPLATLQVEEGCTVRNNKNSNMRIGSVTGGGTLGGSHGWTVGNDSGQLNSFSGTITGSLTKVGNNSLRLSGENIFEGNTDIKNGSLVVGNIAKKTSATGCGTLTIHNQGILTGAGYIENKKVIIASGGILRPGMNYLNSLRIKSDIEQQQGGIIEWQLNGNNSVSAIREVGKLTLKGTLRIRLNKGYSAQLGDGFQLWECKEVSAADDLILELPELPDGLAWDTSGLLKSQGILRITDATGINITSWDEPVEVSVMNLNGVHIASCNCPYNEVHNRIESIKNLQNSFCLIKIKSRNGSCVKKIYIK